ncbi:MAG: hypothetical protein PVF58_14340 [Candidatus Methanofastidiosia archaeon]|jgi:hypothetical protein
MNDTSLTEQVSPTQSKILNFFRQHPRESYSPKVVTGILGLKYNTVKDAMNKLTNKGYLIKKCRGVYYFTGRYNEKQMMKILTTTPPSYHGIQLVIKGGVGVSLTSQEILEATGLIKEYREILINNYDNKSIISINCSNNPLNYMEMVSLLSYLKGITNNSEIIIVNMGINRDIPVRLEGGSIRVEEFNNALFRIYQKGPNRVRVEHHVNGSISVDTLLEIEHKFFKETLENKTQKVID